MGISITSNKITISDTVVSFKDIYDKARRSGKARQVFKRDNFYKITLDIYIINNGAIVDSDVIIEHTGKVFQIEKNSKLQLGKKRLDGSTYGGCRLRMTEPDNTYGFGHKTKDNSGDLLLYDSHIDIWCFWGFFEGTNLVEIIDCSIRGFGRISGMDSILKNINFRYSNGTYGIIIPAGQIKEMNNINCLETLEIYNRRCAFYYYPKLTGDLTIYYGRFGGYEHLANVLDSPGHNTIEFRGSELLDGYKLLRQSDNVDLIHSYRFNAVVTNNDSGIISHANILIKDKNGDIVFNELSDSNGEIDLWVPYYIDKANGDAGIKTPHNITITKGNKSLEFTLYIDRNLEKFPIILQNTVEPSPVIDYEKIRSMMTENKDIIIDELNEIKNEVVSGNRDISSVLITLGEEVEENQTIIESNTGNTRLIL